jgi:hypothetical protein
MVGGGHATWMRDCGGTRAGPAGVLPMQAAQGPEILGAPNFRICLIWRPISFMRGGKLAKR